MIAHVKPITEVQNFNFLETPKLSVNVPSASTEIGEWILN